MKKLIGTILMIPFILWFVVRAVLAIQFNIDCGDHMKRAADANSIALATKEMQVVVDYMERNDMKDGFTSVLYKTPNEDVGFWYENMNSSLQELKTLDSNATSLEKSNVLMKLRETLVDHGKTTTVTVPTGISVYPRNGFFAFWGTLSCLVAIIGLIIFLSDCDFD
jgi:hypothetical protein